MLREAENSASTSASSHHTPSHHTPNKANTVADAATSASSRHTPAEVDTVALASKLYSVGYNVHVRRAVGGGGSTSTCFQNLRHEFLLVKGDGSQGSPKSVDYVVDPKFREQFEIPHPTPEYAVLLAQLPVTFIGPLARLLPIVQVMCAEMAESFKARGLALPPWRKTQSVLSKWMTTNVQDVSFDQAASADQPQAGISLARTRALQRSTGSTGAFASSACGPALRSQQQPLAQHMIKIGFAL